MNWYSVGASALSGALAAVVAHLLVPRRDERKKTYIFVFVLVFSVLNVVTTRLLVPALSVPQELARLEQELLKMPVMQVLKQYEPETYKGFIAELERGLREGRSQSEISAVVKPKIQQAIQSRLPKASDLAVASYMSVMAREMRELRSRDPLLCFQFLFPQQYGAIDISKHLPAALVNDDLKAVAEIVRSSAESPQSAPPEDEVQPDLERAVAEVQRLHGADAALMQNLQDPGIDKGKGCDVTAALYEAVLALPPDRSGKVLRYMLSP